MDEAGRTEVRHFILRPSPHRLFKIPLEKESQRKDESAASPVVLLKGG